MRSRFLRMRAHHREFIIAPDWQHHQYVLVVVHDYVHEKSGLQQAAEAAGVILPTTADPGRPPKSAEEVGSPQLGGTGAGDGAPSA